MLFTRQRHNGIMWEVRGDRNPSGTPPVRSPARRTRTRTARSRATRRGRAARAGSPCCPPCWPRRSSHRRTGPACRRRHCTCWKYESLHRIQFGGNIGFNYTLNYLVIIVQLSSNYVWQKPNMKY